MRINAAMEAVAEIILHHSLPRDEAIVLMAYASFCGPDGRVVGRPPTDAMVAKRANEIVTYANEVAANHPELAAQVQAARRP